MSVGIVSTIGQKCKRCYSCVRECPAAAIRVMNGQAVVITERCISCGHCVKVCSQGAKEIQSDKENVLYNLLPSGNAIAIVAPSFAASFNENTDKVPTALRRIGFDKVVETAFGADLISPIYKNYFESNTNQTIISSPCPAVNNYIEKYFPELVGYLAPIVSPMIAAAKYLKNNFGEDVKIVFIGPCVAKKSEYMDEEVDGTVDAVLTFPELKEIFRDLNMNLEKLPSGKFDPPNANLGKSFPLPGGLLKTTDISSDLLEKDVIVVEGVEKVKEIIKDIAEGKIKAKLIDILFCEGCISGPAIDSELNYYSRRAKVIEFIEGNLKNLDRNIWKGNIYNSRNLNLDRTFRARSQRRPMPSEDLIKEILAKTNKLDKKDELNCGACGYPSCREYAIAIAKDLAEEDMCLPYLIDKLEAAYTDLQKTQEQLHNAEKLASIGQLAAGVAHEINNPLGTIILYSSMLKRELENKGNDNGGKIEDYIMIIEEAKRCKNIVANLLNFARQGKLKIYKIGINDLLAGVIRSIGLRPEFHDVFISCNDQTENTEISADKDQIHQVLLNLISNACESVEESDVKNVTVNLKRDDNHITIEVIDSGCGIPEENYGKIFTPFFTTKKIGKGTGLGLAITYGIVKMHRGEIKFKSSEGYGSTFTVTLPLLLENKDILMNLEN